MKTPTFVVVEDNSFVAKVHMLLINRVAPKARVVVAKNGLKGLAAVFQYRPCGLIVDIDVPGVNGVQMLNMLTSDPEWRDLPVIAVTELSMDEVAAMGSLPKHVKVLSKYNGQLDQLSVFVEEAVARAGQSEELETPALPVESQAEFLDTLRRMLGMKTDRALAQFMSVGPSTISKIRKGSLPVTPFFVLRLHDVSGISVEEIVGLLTHVGKQGVQAGLQEKLASPTVLGMPSSVQ